MIGTASGNALLIQSSYPFYLNIIIGSIKVFGMIVILQTKFSVVKEWIYAGFTFDILGVSYTEKNSKD